MNIDRDSLKEPLTWAVIVPAVLFIWVLVSLFALNSAKAGYEKQAKKTEEVQKYAREILALMDEIGAANLPNAATRQFDALTSARACAKAAFIRDTKLLTGESRKAKVQSDGSVVRGESYRINGVRLLQIARFIDHAEGNYSSVNCTALTLTHSRSSKVKDWWDVSVDLQYVTR